MHGCAGLGIYRDAEKAAPLMISLAIGKRVCWTYRFDAIGEVPWRAVIVIFASGVPNAFDIDGRVFVRGTSGLREQRGRGRDHVECEGQDVRRAVCHLTKVRSATAGASEANQHRELSHKI